MWKEVSSQPVNSISISGMLTGQWNVKPRWPAMESNFVRQFQSPTRVYTSVLVSQATSYIFWIVFFENTHNISWKDRKEFKNFIYISTKSNRVARYIFFTRVYFQTDEKPVKIVSKSYCSKLQSARTLFTVNLPSVDSLAHFLGYTAILTPKYSNM